MKIKSNIFILFDLVGIFHVPLLVGYFSAFSSCLDCCVWGGLSIFCWSVVPFYCEDFTQWVGLDNWLVKVSCLGKLVKWGFLSDTALLSLRTILIKYKCQDHSVGKGTVSSTNDAEKTGYTHAKEWNCTLILQHTQKLIQNGLGI